MFFADALFAAPHVQSKFTHRVTNRKYVSHILHQLRGAKHYVVLITTHGPHHWAFHSRPYPLYHRCEKPAACLDLLMRLDKHLKSGRNLGLSLRGSYIHAFRFYGETGRPRNRR